MRRLIGLLLLSYLLLLSSVAFAYAGLAGKYTGTWTGSQSEGTIKVALTQAEKGRLERGGVVHVGRSGS